jgi:ribosome-associated heat shock protein Hsp15
MDIHGGMPAAGQRIDSWLWCVRLCRSRTRAAGLVASGAVRLNRRKIHKPATCVHVGDVLTLVLHGEVRVFEVTGLSPRRVSAPEAGRLRRELTSSPCAGSAPGESATTRPRNGASSNENRV